MWASQKKGTAIYEEGINILTYNLTKLEYCFVINSLRRPIGAFGKNGGRINVDEGSKNENNVTHVWKSN